MLRQSNHIRAVRPEMVRTAPPACHRPTFGRRACALILCPHSVMVAAPNNTHAITRRLGPHSPSNRQDPPRHRPCRFLSLQGRFGVGSVSSSGWLAPVSLPFFLDEYTCMNAMSPVTTRKQMTYVPPTRNTSVENAFFAPLNQRSALPQPKTPNAQTLRCSQIELQSGQSAPSSLRRFRQSKPPIPPSQIHNLAPRQTLRIPLRLPRTRRCETKPLPSRAAPASVWLARSPDSGRALTLPLQTAPPKCRYMIIGRCALSASLFFSSAGSRCRPTMLRRAAFFTSLILRSGGWAIRKSCPCTGARSAGRGCRTI